MGGCLTSPSGRPSLRSDRQLRTDHNLHITFYSWDVLLKTSPALWRAGSTMSLRTSRELS